MADIGGEENEETAMKKNIFLIVCFIIVTGLTLVSGCTNEANQKSELYITANGNPATHQVTENIWWVQCTNWRSCDSALTNLSQNHKILSFAPLTNGGYGSTTGYYVIIDPREA